MLSRIIRKGELNEVLHWGITELDFTTPEANTLFGRLLLYRNSPETSGAVWGEHTFSNMFPHYVFCDDPSMTTDALCLEVRKDRIKVDSKKLLAEASELLEMGEAVKAVGLLQERATLLRNDCTPKKIDVHITDGLERAWNSYQKMERGESVAVFEWPWKPLQDATLGVRPTDYIIFYGRPKSMKSWILCYLAAAMIWSGYNHRLLFYSKEMDAEEIFERIGCILAEIKYENWTGGHIDAKERAMFEQWMVSVRAVKDQLMIVCLSAQDVKPGQDTVAWLESKVDRYEPHAVFVDGMYLMSDLGGAKKNHERVANISRAMRQMVLRKKIPVIASVQANREAAKNEESNTEEVAFSDSLGQDATMLIRIVNEWKTGQNTLALVMGGTSRRHKLAGFRIYGIPATNFGYYGELSEKEATGVIRNEESAKTAKKNVKTKEDPMIQKAAMEIGNYATKNG